MAQYTSFYKFISEEQREHPFSSGKLTGLLLEVLSACKKIAFLTGQGQLAGQAVGAAETENVQGEQQKKLDILSNDLFIESTQWCGYLAGMASEEMDNSLPVPDCYPRGNYLITFDPLDGSSNIDINVSVGTIFSILELPAGVDQVTDRDFLQSGAKQVCAGYCLYGTSTMLVLTTGRGVNGFTLDPGTGDFYLTMPDIKLPTETNEYSINQSYSVTGSRPFSAMLMNVLPVRRGHWERTTTCGGWHQWLLMCIGCYAEVASLCIRWMPEWPLTVSKESFGFYTRPIP